MTNNFSESVKKIVDNYLAKLKNHLKGIKETDQDELIKEINSHIYESFKNDPTENEIDRILNVLNKLGEPVDVISRRMPKAMVEMGKEKKLPTYILAGVLIALFGLPLGISGIAVLFSIIIVFFSLIFTYFVTSIALVVGGLLGIIVSIARIVDPLFLENFLAVNHINIIGFHFANPVVEGIIGIFVCMIICTIGVLMLYFSKYIIRGVKFIFNFFTQKFSALRKK